MQNIPSWERGIIKRITREAELSAALALWAHQPTDPTKLGRAFPDWPPLPNWRAPPKFVLLLPALLLIYLPTSSHPEREITSELISSQRW